MEFQNQVVLITGGRRGIGEATAYLLAQQGVSVVVVARARQEVEQVADRINRNGGKALAISTDVSQEDQVQEMVRQTLDHFGRIDVLINNAAIAFRKNVIDTLVEEWDRLMAINLRGIFLCSKAVLPSMMKQGSGIILNISSGLGKTGLGSVAAYCTSK